ncbi:PH domain-containing protein [Streptomyces sp. SID11385]|uniref:PH domain-containing protein n=1 Tax=Streptomyces sp. SID11385 TaxID=2706031 RepID=UPI0013CB8C80|nr:PH domain-containing protein [Streptomyces sp. SID11385]NEA44228.1 PH domain-containing protein [Streptomyces sp. SID11385]
MTPKTPRPESVLLLREPRNRVADRAVRYWRVRALVTWTVVLVLEVVALFASPDGVLPFLRWALVLTAFLGACHVLVMPPWRYRVHRWEVQPDSLYVQTGWWVQERRVTAVARIQTVDQKRGPLEQWLGLASVVVTTASAAGAIVVRGLDSKVAEQVVAGVHEQARLAVDDAT